MFVDRKATLDMNDIIVQFAVLWGQTIGSAFSSKAIEEAKEMEQYDSEELLMIFAKWAEEYNMSEESDTVIFFEEKLTDLMSIRG